MSLVLVVDDSKFMRTVLRNTLQDYGYSVIEAANGEEAIEKVNSHDPDVVTMDVEMPRMGGLEATERIMKENPVPILMLSAYTTEGADITLDALKKGAVDFIGKPEGKESPITAVGFGDDFVDTVAAVSRADIEEIVRTAPHVSSDASDRPSPSQQASIARPRPKLDDEETPTIAIGASTGGPSLIEEIVREFPRDLDATIFVVQHMPEGFTERYANRLDNLTEYKVVEGADGMTVSPGTVYIAPGGLHMRVSNDPTPRIVTEELRDHSTTSINITLESIAEAFDPPLVTTLLTGMGGDGADALDSIKEAGGYVIAQDEETSPVFGIPRRAIQTGNVDDVLSDYELVKGIVEGIEESTSQR